jgi:hypothetical protein
MKNFELHAGFFFAMSRALSGVPACSSIRPDQGRCLETLYALCQKDNQQHQNNSHQYSFHDNLLFL